MKRGWLIGGLLLWWPGLVWAASRVPWQKTTVNRLQLDPKFSVKVSAYVSGYLFDLEGYSSPWSRVRFYSTEGNLSLETLADGEGKFRFQGVLAPFQTGDFCLLSVDIAGVANNPLCFPPPPVKTKTVIRGIYLSPTLRLEKGVARGYSYPRARLQVFLFSEKLGFWSILRHWLLPEAEAVVAPSFWVEAGLNGQFSFNLPEKSARWRLFVGPWLKDSELQLTAKSNTLEFRRYPCLPLFCRSVKIKRGL